MPIRARRRRRTRRALAALALLTLGLLGAALWDLQRAYGALSRARATLGEVRSLQAMGSDDAREETLRRLDAASDRALEAADVLEQSLPLRLASMVVPGAGFQRNASLALANDVSLLARASERVLLAADRTVDAGRAAPGRLPLSEIARLESDTRAASRVAGRSVRRSASLWPLLKQGRDEFDREALDLSERTSMAADTLSVLRRMAGDGRERRYLVAGLNNAEMRDQGMVLSFLVVRFVDGSLHVDDYGPIEDLAISTPAPVVVPEGTDQLVGGLRPTLHWQSVNATADFGWSAKTMLAMYGAATGEALDGVVALDVPALRALLYVAGDVTVSGVVVSAANVTRLLLHDQYEGMSLTDDQRSRREAVAEVANAVATRLTTTSIDAVRMGRALATASSGGHIRVYSVEDDENTTLERAGLGGGLVGSQDGAHTFHYAVQNASGAKVDYYLRHVVEFNITTTAAGNAVVRTSVSVRNTVTPGAAASYALGPIRNQRGPGDYPGRVYLWGPKVGRQLDSVEDAGLRASQALVAVAPGERGQVGFETVIPGAVAKGGARLRFVPQPLAFPAHLRVTVNGRVLFDDEWARVENLELAA